jgi:hypothetical protein
MPLRALVIKHLTFNYFTVSTAHLLKKFGVYIVVQIDQGDLFGGHRTNPILVVFESRHGQVKRFYYIIATLFLHAE